MCCPAGEHVNTEGEKTSYKQLSHHPKPLTHRLHMERRREAEQRRSKADGEEGNESANRREMEGIEWQK